MRIAVHLVSLILPSLLLLGPLAQAEIIEAGPTLVCNTQQQVERFVALFNGDAQTAISTVNAEEHDPTACGVAMLVYVRGPSIATTTHKNVTFQIVEILVVGLVTPEGLRAVEPIHFYSFLVDEGSDT